MDLLWDADGWMTPGEVHRGIATPRRPLAYTTVTTVLVRLWGKGMLEREAAGRAFAYRPVVSRDVWAARRMQQILEVSGDPRLTLNHFVDSISPREISQLRRVLEARRKR
jgi:predicted transcriptional regulator